MSLYQHLEGLYRQFDARYESSDPICLVRRFQKPEDQEVAAVIMASLAFGQVGQILKAGAAVFELMENQPRRFVETFRPAIERRRWKGFYYRMVRGGDLLRLLYGLQRILKRHDRLGDWVRFHYRDSDPHLGVAWSRCVADLREIDRRWWRWERSNGVGFRHLLPDPANHGASKRAFLLLRWMVRKDNVDLGLWPHLPPDKLLIPVDTHIGRLAYNIGLTDSTRLNLQTAREITAQLAQFDASDPVKYDFALSRLGILKLCPRKKEAVKCASCSIVSVCRL